MKDWTKTLLGLAIVAAPLTSGATRLAAQDSFESMRLERIGRGEPRQMAPDRMDRKDMGGGMDRGGMDRGGMADDGMGRDRMEPRRAERRRAPVDDGYADEGARAPRRRYVRAPRERAPIAANAPVWQVVAGRDLRSTLADWCQRNGWTLAWKSDFSYEMTTSATFSGTFEDAIRAVIVGMKDTRPSPTVELYGMNKVLLVSNAGASVTE